MQGREHRYLGAISLNNSAVLLVERGHYRQALTVLQDAMFVMRGVTDDDELRGGTTSVRSDSSSTKPGAAASRTRRQIQAALGLDGVLQRASSFVMESAASGSARSLPPRLDVASKVLLDVDGPRLVDVTNGGDHLDAAPRGVIRIDATRLGDGNDTDDGHEDADLALESIVILHNFAATALLLPCSDRSIRRSAANISNIAMSFVHKILHDEYSSSSGICGPFVTVVLLRLSAMVARCGYELHRDLGDCPMAWQSLGQLQTIQNTMADEASLSNFMNGLRSPHAKAA